VQTSDNKLRADAAIVRNLLVLRGLHRERFKEQAGREALGGQINSPASFMGRRRTVLISQPTHFTNQAGNGRAPSVATRSKRRCLGHINTLAALTNLWLLSMLR